MLRSVITSSSRQILRLPQDKPLHLRNFIRLRSTVVPFYQKFGTFALTRKLHKGILWPLIFVLVVCKWEVVAAFLHSSKSSGGGSSNSCPAQPDWKKLTNEEWAERLSPEAYFSTREGGTEPPFSGQYVNHKAEGVYKCVCCGSDLFTSKAKYDSGSGWPSFYQSAERNGITRRKDVSHGMVRIEILCANCNAHLGHVFDDGPQPTGERYCVNSVSLKFSPKKLS